MRIIVCCAKREEVQSELVVRDTLAIDLGYELA